MAYKKVILIKPGEIALKGLNKKKFEAILKSNLKKAIAPYGEFKVEERQSVFIVQAISAEADIETAYSKAKNVFGISKLSLAYVCEKAVEEIKDCSIAVLQEYGRFKTFKVEAKRADKTFKPDSMTLCPIIGDHVLHTFPEAVADMHNPEVRIGIEIREQGAYIYLNEEFGLGGMPVGCCQIANVLLSGGIDSPVAAFMMAKRGMNISCTHFTSPPYTSELAKDKVKKLVKVLENYCGKIKFRCVELTRIQETIKKLCPEELFTILLRRMMFRIAQNISKLNGESAIITGESLGQVASQTMEAITCTDEVCFMPVFRPLIGVDKTEIIERAKKIETFDISILPYEDCCTVFVPKHPKTNPEVKAIKRAEEKLYGIILDAETGEVLPEAYKMEECL